MNEVSTQSPFPYVRDMGQTITASLDFVRRNFKNLIKILLVMVAPASVLTGLFTAYTFSDYFSFILSRPSDPSEIQNYIWSLLPNFIGLMVTSIIASVGLIVSVTEYCIYVHRYGLENYNFSEFLKECLRKAPSYLLILIVVGLMTSIGTVFCYLPGIYLMIVFSTVYAVKANENLSLGDSISRCFKIIKGNWWSTFGLYIVVTLGIGVLSSILIIPLYLIFFAKIWFSLEPTQGLEGDSIFMNVGMIVSSLIAIVGNYMLSSVTHIVYTFRYFSLAETSDGKGMFAQIDRIGSTDADNLPEETY